MLKRRRAFTLLEILVVTVIVGIIATLGMPRYYIALERAHSVEGVQILGAIFGAAKIHQFDTGSLPTNMVNLITIEEPEYFSLPDNLPGTDVSVAVVARDGGAVDYSLRININGAIYCNSDDENYCDMLGY